MNKIPWSHALANNLSHLPKVRPTFHQSVKQVRNRLRRCSADSIVRCALDHLHTHRSQPKSDELKSFPWLVLLLVKLVLEDETIEISRGQVCSVQTFQHCLDTLWDSQGSHERKDAEPGNVYRMIRSIVQPQLLFQRRSPWGFLRWPKLISRLPVAHFCHQLFLERFGLDPRSFMLLAYASHAPVLDDDRVISMSFFHPFRHKLGASVDRFLEEFARNSSGLRRELLACRQTAKTTGNGTRQHHELNELPWLLNYPLLKISGDKLTAWHPEIFSRGMEQAVHRRLSERGEKYSREFGRVFEEYVVELVRGIGLDYLSEKEYLRLVGDDQRAVEAIIFQNDCNVFVEAKLTLYSENVASNTNWPLAWQALKRVREAMNQGWTVSANLRQPDWPDWPCTKAGEDFLVVVTSQPVYCPTGEHFRRLFKHDIFDPTKLAERKQKTPTIQQLNYLPLSNIVIVSIEEWEHMVDCVGRGVIELAPFLREVAIANKEGATSVMFIDQMLEKKVNAWGLSPLIQEARDDATLELGQLLDNFNQ